MTMPLSNKALQMDPLVLSAPLQNTRPHEDPSAFLKNLDQVWTHSTSCSSSSIEEYITQSCELFYRIPFDDIVLKDLLRFRLSEPIKSWLPEGKFNCSLKHFMDYILLCASRVSSRLSGPFRVSSRLR